METISARDCQITPSRGEPAPTHCPYCALQCGMDLVLHRGTIKVAPRAFPTSNGGLCQKGWTAAELLDHPQRLRTPLIRESRASQFREASWDEAFDRIVAELEKIRQRYGRDAIGIFGGGGLTNEKAYLLGKFARVALGTRNIDYNGRFCMASAAAAGLKAFGLDRGLPFPLSDIPGAETILLVGANVAETMPPIMQYFEAQRRHGGNLIVADPRATPTARAARLHLQLTPGTDAALANGLLHIAIAENLIDHEFIAARTTGFENARKTAVAAYWPERVERITGVPVHQLYETARMLGRARTAMILTARGAEQHSHSVNNLLALINLALALGKSGRPHCGFGCITGQGNGQGGREHGQKADQLPGYRSIEDAAAREHVAQVWRVTPASLPRSGTSAYEMLDSAGLDGGVRAMLVLGSNLAVSAPNLARIRQRLSNLEFLVVADFFMSETALLADVVLPSAQWAEEEGTVTNLEGRVILRRRAAMPPARVRTDLEILSMLASRLGCAAAFPTEAEKVFEELRHASAHGPADYSGISYKRLESQPGVFWPCPDESHPGTPRVFLDRYATPDGRARFHAVEYQPPAELPDDDYPFFLTTGRVAAHYQSGTQTRLVARLMSAEREACAEMHPAAARALGIADGDPVRVVTRRGAAIFKARFSTAIRMDTLFVPFHWPGEASANLLTNPALDSSSKMPEFKVCAARVERIATTGAPAALSARGGNTNSSE